MSCAVKPGFGFQHAGARGYVCTVQCLEVHAVQADSPKLCFCTNQHAFVEVERKAAEKAAAAYSHRARFSRACTLKSHVAFS
jgi:hypothetical protein